MEAKQFFNSGNSKQFLSENSQADEHGGRSFASSFKEESSRDSPGEGLEEEASGNEVEDSGVAFPFLDRATQEENQVEQFGGDNQADLEKAKQFRSLKLGFKRF